MRLIFVRHGEPDYVHDCLTEHGKEQAQAAAVRLAPEGIEEIYSSPNGRALETASYTAKQLGLPVKQLDYMHEINWGGPDVPENGHPWTLADWMISEDDFDFYHKDWRQHPYFANNIALQEYDYVSGKFDAFMEQYGYHHEGTRFLCTTDCDRTIAVFSHGGSGACVLAHLLALPFPYTLTVLPYDLTSIIILEFPVKKGEYVHPRVELFNDISHTRRSEGGPAFSR